MTAKAQAGGMMTIGEMARTAGVATPTLRYYEQEGLLSPTARSRAGYRLYNAEAVEQLRFIRSAQAVGFTLEDIRALARLEGESGKNCKAKVRRLLEKRLSDVNEKMKDLKRVQRALGQALDRCQRSNGECKVLKEIRPARKTRR
jgi:MerR family transcriptional regulator, mercuric resistance operon regulatory protein